ncbi:Uncharacterised protein [Klebsiella pneumoniae]|uniref:Uncharacterized protein n=1 Tax=Klebsiella pneumoniae TaxID=573 RepID=A0A3S5DGT9_KLEPN|nr:Uncharacterised protein [Klebsiella pneumoniae]
MPNHAATVASSSSGTQTSAALLRVIVEPSGWVTPWTPRKVKSGRKMTAGATICITLTPQIAKAAVDSQRAALFRFGEKETDISHAGSKIRSGKTAQQRNNNKYPERSSNILDCHP